MSKIFLKIPDRPFGVPISLSTAWNEEFPPCYEDVDEAFKNFAAKDPNLSSILSKSFPIYVYEDPEDKILAQLNPNEPLPPGVKIYDVQFVAKNDNSQTFSHQGFETSSPPGDLDLGDRCILQNEGGLLDASSMLPKSPSRLEEMLDLDTSAAPSNSRLVLQALDPNQQARIDCQMTRKKARNNEHITLLKMADIPPIQLGPRVQSILKEGKILTMTAPFIHEVGQHLFKVKADPRKVDVETFVTFLLNTIPELDSVDMTGFTDTKIGNWIFKLLSNYVRNCKHRHGRDLMDDHVKRGSLNYHKNLPEAGSSSSVDENTANNQASANKQAPQKRKAANDRTSVYVEDASDPHAELKKKRFDATKVLESLEHNFNLRRQAVAGFNNVAEMLKLWPAFSSFAVIEAELSLCINVDKLQLQLNFESLIHFLEQHYNQSCQTEAMVLNLLAKMETDLQVNIRVRRPNLFSIVQLGTQTLPEKPEKVRACSPVTVSYVATDGNIRRTYLIAESKVISSIANPSSFQVYTLLIGSYFAYGLAYPNYSENVCYFLEKSVFKRSISSSSHKLNKFLTEFNIFNNNPL